MFPLPHFFNNGFIIAYFSLVETIAYTCSIDLLHIQLKGELIK
jgi:hypothetical protein